jgi:PHD/YefM family antitoxin component YafN of YafNO toxin-antitoxin module
MSTLSTVELRNNLKKALDQIEENEVTYITDHNKKRAAIVPPEVGELWQQAEDQYWIERAEKAKKANNGFAGVDLNDL